MWWGAYICIWFQSLNIRRYSLYYPPITGIEVILIQYDLILNLITSEKSVFQSECNFKLMNARFEDTIQLSAMVKSKTCIKYHWCSASHSSLAEMWAKNILSNQIVFKFTKG